MFVQLYISNDRVNITFADGAANIIITKVCFSSLQPLPSLRTASFGEAARIADDSLAAAGVRDKQCKFDVAFRCQEADNNLRVNILADVRIFTRACGANISN